MLKNIYLALVVILIFIFFGLYFTNLMYVTNQYMFLFSQSNHIWMWTWMFLLWFIWFCLGVFTTLLISSLFRSRPKDFDEFDL